MDDDDGGGGGSGGADSGGGVNNRYVGEGSGSGTNDAEACEGFLGFSLSVEIEGTGVES